MSVALSPIAGAGWQFFDNSGNPLSGGFIYTYAAGTSTPQVTYTTSSGSIANSNPIQLDAAGRTPDEVWLTQGDSYKFVLKDKNSVLIGTYDNISGVNDFSALANTTNNSLGDALIGFRQSNSSGFLLGTVGKTVNDKLQEIVSVKDFGALGNGIANDTTAIQAAMNSGAASIIFPSGTYLSDEITVPSTVHYISGSGTFKQRTTNSKLMSFSTINGITIDGMTFQGNYTYPQITQSSANTGLTFTTCTDVKIVNCSFSYIQFIGIRLIDSSYIVVSNNRMNYVGNPIYLRGSQYATITGNVLTNTIADDSVFVIGISCESTDGHAYGTCSFVTIDSNIVTGFKNAQGIMAHSLTNGVISNNVVYDPIIGISLNPYNSTDSLSYVTISGNTIKPIDSLSGYSGGASCITVQAGGSTPDITDVSIVGNVCVDGNRAEQGNNQGAIQIGYTKNVSVIGNTITNAYCNGIVLTEDEDGIVISGNVIKDIQEISGGTLNGIICLGAPKGNITGNTFENINSTAGTGYAIRFNASAAGMYVGDNHFHNVESLGTGFQYSGSNGRVLIVTEDTPSISLNNVDVVVFEQSVARTITTYFGVVPYKKYTFYFTNGNTTIDRTNAYLNGGANIVGTQYDVVVLMGLTSTQLAQVSPTSVNS